ncbi:MAG: HEPN domain-containing protein [Phormidesmis sp.]
MNTEQKRLIEKAKESLRAAQLLSESSMHGFAASRAYYSMFYIAQAFLLEEELAFSSHAAVISSFGKTFAKTNRLPPKFHRYLIDGAEARTEGDYSTVVEVSSDNALEMIDQAKEFIQLANQLK